MTDKEKAEEILECEKCHLHKTHTICDNCFDKGLLLKMAQWKDEQMMNTFKTFVNRKFHKGLIIRDLKKSNGGITMATTKEDYCSKEIYRLLIEKGFDGEIHTTFDEEGYTQASITLQMAMKWLREVSNIHIIIHRYPVKLNYSDVKLWYSEIITLTTPESVDKQFFLNEENDTYEAACNTAIKYCLENLI